MALTEIIVGLTLQNQHQLEIITGRMFSISSRIRLSSLETPVLLFCPFNLLAGTESREMMSWSYRQHRTEADTRIRRDKDTAWTWLKQINISKFITANKILDILRHLMTGASFIT